jgi:hypothetical protein
MDSAQGVAIKITLQRFHGVEVRRVRGDYTFAQLQSVMGQWWQASHLRWQYRDLDGDTVTLGSEEEWCECVRLHLQHGSGPLRLTVSKACKDRAPATALVPPQREVVVPVPPEVQVPLRDTKECAEKEDATRAIIPPPVPVEVEAAEQMLAALYGNDVVKRLWTGDVAPCLSKVVRVLGRSNGSVWNPLRPQVDVDINISALREVASRTACHMMEQLQHVAARDLLAKALKLPVDRPSDSIIARYNYACALALCGEADAAVQELRTAIIDGYSNFAHMERDADLASLRTREDFMTLCRPSAAEAPKPSSTGVMIEFPGHECPLALVLLHGLKGYGPHGCFRCDVCDGKGRGTSFHCGRCNYDVCSNCMSAFQGTMTPVQVVVAEVPSTVAPPAVVVPQVAAKEKEVVPQVVAKEEEPTPAPNIDNNDVDPKCASLMTIFPGMDTTTAAEILAHARGDVRRAIEMFLGA